MPYVVSFKYSRVKLSSALDNTVLVVSEDDMVIIDGAGSITWNEQTCRYELALPCGVLRKWIAGAGAIVTTGTSGHIESCVIRC